MTTPDRLFALPELARLYDPLDPHREDLHHYVDLLETLGARSVLDVGCGTGSFALLMARHGIEVLALDPAEASLDVARAKPGAATVTWICGHAGNLPHVEVDAVTMTGNVAQVFVTDDEWATVLTEAHRVLRPGGHLIFESRDPKAQAWLRWTRQATYRETVVSNVGRVACWEEVTEVTRSTVSFTTTFVYRDTGTRLTSSSTLRFRSADELTASLLTAGFRDVDVRDAPDRPGLELVYTARRPEQAPT